ncbi:hypothetical protein F0562_033135 [Nyssa sinensis]|uniref:Uncharacterized protein n=1 Tax=Nyssa sinensis TaxID=561372 RepID=A0A5J5AQN0_9ASTE|nr:hypothetical protein F0562_033135 [Nyssa sinensis]
MRQLEARTRSPENGLRRPATRVRLPDMDVRRRPDGDTTTVAGMDIPSSLEGSWTQHRTQNRKLLDSMATKMKRRGFKGHRFNRSVGLQQLGQSHGLSINTFSGPHTLGHVNKRRATIYGRGQPNTLGSVINRDGPHRSGQDQGLPNTSQIGLHGLGQGKKRWAARKKRGQPILTVIKGLANGSLNLAQRSGKILGAQSVLTETSPGHSLADHHVQSHALHTEHSTLPQEQSSDEAALDTETEQRPGRQNTI